jgi:hypothetical protein
MTPEGQKSQQTGNIIGFFFRRNEDAAIHRDALSSSIYLAKNFLHRMRQGLPGLKSMCAEDGIEMGRHLKVLSRDAPQLGLELFDLIGRRFFSKRRLPFVLPPQNKNFFPLYYQAEHSPNAESRVELAKQERDDLGMPRLMVKIRFSEIDLHTVERFFKAFEGRLKTSRAGEFFYRKEELEQQLLDRQRNFNSNAHHIGTTRMSESPRTGVVDFNCRVHGTSNLYVGGSSVYPTSSHANPTLLAVMLALRLAEHLVKKCSE